MTKVYGWGINDSRYPVKVGGKHIPAYAAWVSMLKRCYSPKYHTRHPTYMGCSVCDEWLVFSTFHAWHMDNYRDRYHLDKDILVPGNKTYGPDTCSFVPEYINNLLVDREHARGQWPLGVSWSKQCSKFQAGLKVNGRRKHIGRFNDPMEAHEAYKLAKKAYVKQVATEAFLANEIKSDVYLALVRREF